MMTKHLNLKLRLKLDKTALHILLFLFFQPAQPRELSELPYCLQTQPTYKGFANYDCRYYDENLVV